MQLAVQIVLPLPVTPPTQTIQQDIDNPLHSHQSLVYPHHSLHLHQVLPDRFYQPKTDGVLSSLKADRAAYDKGLKYYYALMGWDAKTGVPTPERVEELGIEK